MPTPDAGEASVMVVGGGVLPAYDAGHGPCNGGPCGSVAMPTPDASEASVMVVGGGVLPAMDSGHGPCNGGPCGVIINPEAGFD